MGRYGSAARLARSELGTAVLEFTIAAPIVLLLMMGIFEFGRLYYTRLTLQHAVHEAARFAVTGNTLNDPKTGDPMERAEAIRHVIVTQAKDLDLDVERLVIDPPDGGGPSDVVTVSGSFAFEFVTPLIGYMFPGSGYEFEVETSMKNEPFFNE
jgi:hypothetical protein